MLLLEEGGIVNPTEISIVFCLRRFFDILRSCVVTLALKTTGVFGKARHVIDPVARTKDRHIDSEPGHKHRFEFAKRPAAPHERDYDAAVEPAIAPRRCTRDVNEPVFEVVGAGWIGLESWLIKVSAVDMLLHHVYDPRFHR